MMFGLSGTAGLGRSGTESSDYREPKWAANPQKCWATASLNNPNKESNRFLLTRQDPWTNCGDEPPDGQTCTLAGDPSLTHVTLIWKQGVREDWLRFGKPVASKIIDRTARIESYAPGQCFALVRWASNDYGTIHSELQIVRAVDRGEDYTTLSQVDPGGELLLSVKGWPKVRQVFAFMDAIEQADIDPCEASPDHWRHIHNRLAAGTKPRGYSHSRHQVWLKRRRLLP